MKEGMMLLYLAVLSVYDWREKKVPVGLLCLGTGAAVGWNLYVCLTGEETLAWVAACVLAGMFPGVFLFLAAYLTGKMGYGDGWVLLNLGLILGYRTGLLLLSFGVLLMACCCVLLLAVRRVDRNTRIPFLPFLTVVYTVGMLMGA